MEIRNQKSEDENSLCHTASEANGWDELISGAEMREIVRGGGGLRMEID